MNKLWGGRFGKKTDRMVEEFTSSLPFDRRLYRYDIEGSMAHCRMLRKQGFLSAREEKKILSALGDIRRRVESGKFAFDPADEDIHLAVEKALIRKTGSAGEKIHTGRSRNDQVALDIRLFLRDEVKEVLRLTGELKSAILRKAKAEIDTVMPGYTHLQKAQPVLLSHCLLAYREMFDRDEARLKECLERINVMPLGSAALAGAGLPLDRNYVAKLLKFPRLSANSMDAVSDRDFVAEFIFDAGLLMMHMSRLCEDLILWASDEFGFVEISDAFTTGSSIMPQKKNPDVAELIRGKTGRVYGNLVSVLTVLKGLPMTYNRDLQEDKEPLFDTVDTVKASLAVLTAMIGNLTFRREKMKEAASGGYSTATDIADYLVRKGVPFRRAHAVTGKIVGVCLKKGRNFSDLSLAEFRKFHPAFEKDIFRVITVESSVSARQGPGGTSKKQVVKRIRDIESQGKK
ncbi:MAG: argininosuccinate lyase [Deltaproteobacteria bacterium]|nr:argininosuccinate lyase [Deltaproteobacteria bacterium]